MSILHLLTRPATLVRRDSADPLEPDAELVPVDAGETLCELQQSTDTEHHDGRVQSTTWRVWLPAELAGVTGWDALRVDGELFELDGDPWPVRNPRTSVVSHVEARVTRTR